MKANLSGRSYTSLAFGHCDECGKYSFTNRSLARRAARLVDRSMAAYRCPHSEWWHVGHMPTAVRRGDIDRATMRQMRGWA